MTHTMRTVTTAIVLLVAGDTLLAAAPPPRGLGDPGTLKAIVIDTGRTRDGGFLLHGPDSWQQLVVTGQYSSGQQRDLTRSVKYEAAPAGVVAVDASGLVTPLKEGEATITVRADSGLSAGVKVTVSSMGAETPINFANQIVPIFTKFGCNAGGCHGKASGQNGFRLSLFGFDPPDDYEYVVKEARGRRLFPAAPAHSLLLLKATGTVAHGGGKKLPADSLYYRTILRWIQQGTPWARRGDPDVSRIEVLPRDRVMERETMQQLTVVAHLSDGSTVDVTRLAQFDSNNLDLAVVSDTGLITTQKLPGSVAIMTRFQGNVDVCRITVPLGVPVAGLPPARSFIDELVYKQLQKLGLPPSPLADDSTFIRRVTIDLAGRLPTKEETENFLADKSADRHDKLVDRLLESKDYADYFANKWNAVLRNRRRAANDDPAPHVAFHTWIRDSLHNNKPYDQFVREILTATGPDTESPPVLWYREVKDAPSQVEDAAQLFLGQRLGCARCHHHPFEKWSQHDYYSLAAFFSRLDVKDPPPPKTKAKKGEPPPPRQPVTVSHKSGQAQFPDPRTAKPIRPAGLGGPLVAIDPKDDPRPKLVDWMTAPENPFFARSLVNRYWKHFFGRGLVDPEDDMRLTNPASNPELLDALAKNFADNKYDLKKLVRLLATSNVYRFSAVPNEYNAEDRQNHSRFIPRRLNAEVLLDAIDEVTLSKTNFKGVPPGTRAVQLPDNQVESYFLSVFGRPDSASACECERSSDATLAQALHLFNSTEMLAKVSGARAKQLAADKRGHPERLRDLYMVALSRPPTAEEQQALLGHIDRRGNAVQAAYEDIIWALLNTKEFLFNH